MNTGGIPSNLLPLRKPSHTAESQSERPVEANPLEETHQPIKLFGRTFYISGRVLLMLVPMMWASYIVIIKLTYLLPWSLNPVAFNVARLFIASGFVLPTVIKHFRKGGESVRSRTVLAGSELGFWTFVVNCMQIYGLKYTTASRGTFLHQLFTIIVPFTAFAVGLESSISPKIYGASLVSVAGVALLSLDDMAVPLNLHGDGMLLASAFAGAWFLIKSKRHADLPDSSVVIGMKVISQFLFSLIFLVSVYAKNLSSPTAIRNAICNVFVGATPLMLGVQLGLLFICGIVVSWVSTIVQLKGQKLVSASEAAVIFTTTPLWSALMAAPMGERFGLRGILGAFLILFASMVASKKPDKSAHAKKVLGEATE